MLIAEINGIRSKATKGAHGFCPYCRKEVIAKCGEQKIPHWAHKSKQECDNWNETETDWHLKWKNYFPQEWQEFVMFDLITGEKHIADIKTDKDFVIEFQHSPIKPEERRSRENFYQDMIWIVDCTERYYNKLVKNSEVYCMRANGMPHSDFSIYDVWADKCFPKTWITSNVPIVFDYLGLEESSETMKQNLYVLFPQKFPGNTNRLTIIRRETFIHNAITGGLQSFMHNSIKGINDEIQRLQNQY